MNLPRVGAAVLMMALAIGTATPALAGQVPYDDPQSSGSLTLCDSQGHELRSGSTSTQPLAPLVIGSTQAPADYRTGATATLLAYQPREGLAPGQWSGELLTGASRYTTPSHPTVAALPQDLSLGTYVQDFPTQWDGLVQLRVYLGARDKQIYKQKYDTADLKVEKGRWTMVRGGGGSCSSGKAIAVAEILGVAATPTPAAVGVTSPASGSPQPSSSSTTTPASSATSAVNSSSSRDVGGGYVLPLVGGGFVALLVAGVSLLVRRRPASS